MCLLSFGHVNVGGMCDNFNVMVELTFYVVVGLILTSNPPLLEECVLTIL